MRAKSQTNRLELVLALILVQLILFPAALGMTYASSSTRPEHILTYTTGALKWDAGTKTDDTGAAQLELFRRDYHNVSSADGQAVLAPGTAGETLVRLKNNAGRTVRYTAVLYEIKTDNALPIAPQLTGDSLTDTDGYTLPGGVERSQVVRAVSGTVDGGQRQDFSVLWSWVFDNGASQDAVDTSLGDRAADTELLGLYITVEDQGSSGATVIVPGPKTADDFSPLWYALAALAAAALAVLITQRRKNRG